MKNINYQSNYRTNARNVQLKIDEVFAEREIPADDSVRLLDQMVDDMDLRPLWSTYKRTGRKPATNPATMLKIMLYANTEGIYSSRDIEKACNRERNYIWLLNGAKAPNYHEIARFRSIRLAECGKELFYQEEPFVAAATGKYIGEGFDEPRLDTLFLAMPIAWKGTLAQYAGRLHRERAGKRE